MWIDRLLIQFDFIHYKEIAEGCGFLWNSSPKEREFCHHLLTFISFQTIYKLSSLEQKKRDVQGLLLLFFRSVKMSKNGGF